MEGKQVRNERRAGEERRPTEDVMDWKEVSKKEREEAGYEALPGQRCGRREKE